jgi:(1->4)-alpha-D-glucan 1-alpha-D-glucosylmutase
LTAARIPRATYRLQLHADFRFADATALVPYLAALGVSHVYCSPYLRARPGSLHGYDIVEHGALNPEIGSEAEFEAFVAALKAHGMGQLFDMVPNHMAVMGSDNAWWLDVLEHGPASRYAGYFDIDWQPVNIELTSKVLVPVLGEQYGVCLERGELKADFDAAAGSFGITYFSHRFPVDPREYPRLLGKLGTALDAREDTGLAALSAACSALPSRTDTAPGRAAERERAAPALKHQLSQLASTSPRLAAAIDRALREINGTPGERASFGALHELLEAQAYRLAYWRVASDEINYRRFFDINELAAVRMENPDVFEATHRLALDLAAAGKVDGLRIDHPDGLYDPAAYFLRLQESYAARRGEPLPAAAGGKPARPLYVVIEKITEHGEDLPPGWAVHGTTGYRFAAVVNGLFIDGAAQRKIERVYRGFVPEVSDFNDISYRGKREVVYGALASELAVLATELLRIARADRRTRDYTYNNLRQALAEVAACFPVYRTYVTDRASPQDERYVTWAIAQAKKRSTAADTTVLDFIRRALLAIAPDDAPPGLRERMRGFAMKFQQFTAPANAKGVEDTAFYRYFPLASINEVGTDGDSFGFPVSAFHGASSERAAQWPHTLLATSTHDNKRSEDVRARIDVLSESPAMWRLMLRRWSRLNRTRKRKVDAERAPSRNDEYLLYQTLIGTLPPDAVEADALNVEVLAAYRGRIEAYMLKAVREAKVHTSWHNVNEAYETAVVEFVRGLLGKTEGNLFLNDLREQVRGIAWFGALNSVSMALVKLTSPGVPDIYQGNEMLDFSLVDPDNRRPVDYERRKRMLDELKAAAAASSFSAIAHGYAANPGDGRAKLWVISRALELRRAHPALFELGDYLPLAVEGPRAAHLVAYARRHDGVAAVTIAGRLWASLGLDPQRPPLGAEVWKETFVDVGALGSEATGIDVLTGAAVPMEDRRIRVADAFAAFPGALVLFPGKARRTSP